AGKFLLKIDGKSAGEETFDINCRADGGYSVTGRTELKVPGASSDLATTLELDKEGLPKSSTAKGTVLGQAFEQTVTIKDHSALLTSPDGSREIPYEKGTPLLGGNIFYMTQFLLARYDARQGGRQEVTSFPSTKVKLERVARDQL